MKQYKIILAALIIITTAFILSSCKDDVEEYIKASLELGQTEISVPYTAGDSTISVTANGDFTVTIDDDGVDWLSYEINSEGDSFTVSYLQNDSTIERSSSIYIINDDVMRILELTQGAFPSSSITEIDVAYSVTSGGGYTVLSISADECDKIPVGATLMFDCGDEGTISFLDDSYAEFVGGSPVNGTFSFVWTQDIADITATDGITTCVLRDNFEVNSISAIYSKTTLEYNISTSSGYTIFSVAAEECEKISVGASFVFESSSDDGYITLLDDSYNVFAYCAPVNGKSSFEWTNDIYEITEESGITTGICRDNFDISSVYFTYVETELNYSVTSSGGYTILSLPVEDCANVPIGATVVIECSSDAGTISILDASYNEVAGGSPTDGIFSFVWTSDIAATFATSGITTGVIRDGFDITAMYCYN